MKITRIAAALLLVCAIVVVAHSTLIFLHTRNLDRENAVSKCHAFKLSVDAGNLTENNSDHCGSLYRIATINAGNMFGFPKSHGWYYQRLLNAYHIAEEIRFMDADLIGIQEMSDDFLIQAIFKAGLGRDYNYSRLSVRSSRDIVVVWRNDGDLDVTPLPNDEAFPKYWGLAEVKINNTLWKLHVGKFKPGVASKREAIRDLEISGISDKLEKDLTDYDGRVLMLSDLNFEPGSQQMDKLTNIGFDNTRKCTDAYTQPTKQENLNEPLTRNIDHILVGKKCADIVSAARVLNTGRWVPTAGGIGLVRAISDHLPVIVDMRIE